MKPTQIPYVKPSFLASNSGVKCGCCRSLRAAKTRTPSLIIDTVKNSQAFIQVTDYVISTGCKHSDGARQLWGENYEAGVEWRLYEKEMKME